MPKYPYYPNRRSEATGVNCPLCHFRGELRRDGMVRRHKRVAREAETQLIKRTGEDCLASIQRPDLTEDQAAHIIAPPPRPRKYGAPIKPRGKRRPARERLLELVLPGPGGCWLYGGQLSSQGYGIFNTVTAHTPHRAAYEIFVGPIPKGLEIDHVCHTRDRACRGGPGCLHRRCFNPEHLEAVTPQENRRRKKGNTAVRLKTHCPQGHAYTPDNVYLVAKTGSRNCRACGRARMNARNALLRSRKSAA